MSDLKKATFTVSCGASFNGEKEALIERIVVQEEVNLPSMAEVCINLKNMASNQFGSYSGIKLGTAMTVGLGFDSADSVFKGEVTAIAPSFGGTNLLTVRGYDKMHRLRFGTKTRVFKQKRDDQIAKQIAGEHGLSPKADATKIKHEHIYQHNLSNYEFLLERAKRLGFELYCDGSTLHFRKPGWTKGPKVTLKYMDSDKAGELIFFEPELRTVSRGSQVEARGWDPKTKKVITGKAKKGQEFSSMGAAKLGVDHAKPMGASPIQAIDYPILNAQEAKELATGLFNLEIESSVLGRGEARGNSKIRAGNCIKIAGCGTFSGTYYIMGTRHIFDSITGYRTQFRVTRVGV